MPERGDPGRDFAHTARNERYRNRSPEDTARLTAIDARADRLRDKATSLHAARYEKKLKRAMDNLAPEFKADSGTDLVMPNVPISHTAGLAETAAGNVAAQLTRRLDRIERGRMSGLAQADFDRAATRGRAQSSFNHAAAPRASS
jgi:hypothetical protein